MVERQELRELRERRIAAGLSQRAVAERAGIAASNYSAIETGMRGASAEMIRRLEEALHAAIAANPQG